MIDEYCVEDLRDIAENYNWYDDISDEKLDFDKALDSIGKGCWQGIDSVNFSDYNHFGRLQQVVIADILGVEDCELEKIGLKQIQQLKGRAYKWMLNYLYAIPRYGYGTRFVAKP